MQSPDDNAAQDHTLLKRIISEAEAQGARVGIVVIFPDGSRFEHRPNEMFKSASTIKIAIMVDLFRRIDAGALSLDQPYRLTPGDKVPGSGVLQQLHDGLDLTLRDVLYLMISISDNPATNILIDHLGFESINGTMRDLGLTASVLGRKMMGRPAIDGEQENLGTPAEFARLIEAILAGTAASAESCFAMMRMLQLQQNGRRIGRFVPEGMEWGSKTGSYATVVNDVGFVMSADGPLTISAFTEDVPDIVAGEIIIADCARAVLVDHTA